MGLARVGSTAGNGSGEIIVAFSTAYRLPEGDAVTYPVELVNDLSIDPLFAATIEATEEAVVNSLCMAETTIGLFGRTVEAMPLEWVEDAKAPLG
jgi:D-aminopeptidase